MQEMINAPGMLAVLAFVLLIEALSLLMLVVNVHIFRSRGERFRSLLTGVGDDQAWGTPGRIVIPLYIFLTIGSAIVTIVIFFFQPHVL